MDMVTTLLMAAIHVKKYGSIKNKVMVTEHRKKQMLERCKNGSLILFIYNLEGKRSASSIS